jgi:hypothetical protein
MVTPDVDDSDDQQQTFPKVRLAQVLTGEGMGKLKRLSFPPKASNY